MYVILSWQISETCAHTDTWTRHSLLKTQKCRQLTSGKLIPKFCVMNLGIGLQIGQAMILYTQEITLSFGPHVYLLVTVY